MDIFALRGSSLSFHKNASFHEAANSYSFIEDALIVIEGGHIKSIAPYEPKAALGLSLTHYREAIICPGFIDCHVHYPQTQIIGAFGEQLLQWLNTYTFVAEQQFANEDHCAQVARFFMGELLRAGTTTASVYATVHPVSVEAFFEVSSEFNTRMI
ncbi:MAG: amidohydrolase family protein, partial [Candidatus Adiutrix sp.]